jgi:hypothetical protein
VYGQVYYYYISTVNASLSEGTSKTVSGGATATQSSLVNTNTPFTPGTPTFNSESVYTAYDGTILAYVTLNVPAMPSGAYIQSIMYRATGTSSWISGSEDNNTSSVAMTISDLTTNQSYDFKVRAYNESGVYADGSTYTRSAPYKQSAPTAISSGQLAPNAPTYFSDAAKLFLWGTQATWTPNTDRDFAYYLIKATYYNSSTDTNSGWISSTPVVATQPIYNLYNLSLTPSYVWVAAVNTSGVVGSYTGLGNCNGYATKGSGTIATQAQTSPALTGVAIGSIGASSVVPLNTVYTGFTNLTVGSGSNYYQYNGFPISGRGFTVAPMYANFTTNVPKIQISYNASYGGQTSTSVTLDVQTTDGSAISSGTSILVNFQFIA